MVQISQQNTTLPGFLLQFCVCVCVLNFFILKLSFTEPIVACLVFYLKKNGL